jgi:AcrR family transcriptional regulator/DNA-binding transcriptional ArsR family regulator
MPASILHEKPASRARRSTLGEPRTQRGRLVAAVGAVAWEHGPGSLTVERVCDRAGMSRRTFYDLFANADDALASAVEDAHEQLWREIDRQVGTAASTDWPTAMSTVVVALLAAVERDPAIGWLCVGELATVLPRAQAARRQSMSRLATLVHDGDDSAGCEAGESARAQAAMGATGALWELVRQRLADRDPEHPVRELAGPAIFLVLVPYVGRAAAMRLATHPPVLALSGPGSSAVEVSVGRLTELTQQSLLFLRDRPLASNVEVAEAIGVTHASQMSRHLRRLAKERLVVGSREGRRNAWSLTEHGAQVVAALGGGSETRRGGGS